MGTIPSVSIPFKRESVSQAKVTETENRLVSYVSIPFKRESVSQEEQLIFNFC